MRSRIIPLLAVSFAAASSPAFGQTFVVVTGGRAQFNEGAGAQATILAYNSVGLPVFPQAFYLFDSARIQVQSLQTVGDGLCSQSGASAIRVAAASFASFQCVVQFVPVAPVLPANAVVPLTPISCGAPCVAGEFRILQPQFRVDFAPPDNAFTLKGAVGGLPPARVVRVTNTDTFGSVLRVATAPTAPVVVTPSTPLALGPGAFADLTISCPTIQPVVATSALPLAHNGNPEVATPFTYQVTCDVRTPPVLDYSPDPGNTVDVSASAGAATFTKDIPIATLGGDAGGARAVACTVPSNYTVGVVDSPVESGATTAKIRLGCSSTSTGPGTLQCVETPGGALIPWPLTCTQRAVLVSTPRPGSAVGVFSAIGVTGFVDADIAVSNRGTLPLTLSCNSIVPSGIFGVAPTSSIDGGSNGTINVSCLAPPLGTSQSALLSCTTNEPRTVQYKLVCVAPPMTDPGEGSSPTDRLSSPSPDGGALLGTATVIAYGPNGEEVVAVGAPNGGADGDGRVYVYVRQPGAGAGAADAKRGLGRLAAVLMAPTHRGKAHAKGIGNKFGDAVALSGDGTLIAVGAPTGGASNVGQVLVFERPPGGWDDLEGLVPRVLDPPANAGVVATDFGEQVDFTSDGMLVVGAPGAIVDAIDDAGAVYLFDANLAAVGNPLKATTPQAGAAFGTAIDVGSGTLAVGSPGEGSDRGAAYLFELDAGVVGAVSQQTAPGGSIGDKWGSSIAVAGNAVIVGAPNDDTAAGADSGSATVLVENQAGTLSVVATLVPTGSSGTQGAGMSLATNGDIVVLGAPLSESGAQVDRGRALVFDLEAAAFGVGTPAGVYENSIGEAGDRFGSSIGISRGRLLLGAPLSDEGPDVDEGRVDPFDLDRIHRGNFEF